MITCTWCGTSNLPVTYSTKEISRPGIDRNSIKRVRYCEKCKEAIPTIELKSRRLYVD